MGGWGASLPVPKRVLAPAPRPAAGCHGGGPRAPPAPAPLSPPACGRPWPWSCCGPPSWRPASWSGRRRTRWWRGGSTGRSASGACGTSPRPWGSCATARLICTPAGTTPRPTRRPGRPAPGTCPGTTTCAPDPCCAAAAPTGAGWRSRGGRPGTTTRSAKPPPPSCPCSTRPGCWSAGASSTPRATRCRWPRCSWRCCRCSPAGGSAAPATASTRSSSAPSCSAPAPSWPATRCCGASWRAPRRPRAPPPRCRARCRRAGGARRSSPDSALGVPPAGNAPPAQAVAGCRLAQVLTQYGVGANHCWLLAEGLHLHALLALRGAEDARLPAYLLLGWGTPLLFVGPWAVVRYLYENTQCWERIDNRAHWWIVRCPLLLAVLVNFVLFVRILRVLGAKLRAPHGRCPDYKLRLARSTLTLVPLLGSHELLFALLPEEPRGPLRFARLFLHLFLSSFQGLLVSVLYCFLNKEVQAELRRQLQRCQLGRSLRRARGRRRGPGALARQRPAAGEEEPVPGAGGPPGAELSESTC